MREHLYFVYILASQRNGTLYVGVTNDLMRRTFEHKSDLIAGFTKKYGVHILVWYEAHDDINTAIAREKRLKRWNRAWKIKLIEQNNSGWNDLYDRMMGEIALPDLPGSGRRDWLTAALKRSHAVEDLPETIVEAVRTAKMDRRHDGLNRLIGKTERD